MKRQLENLNDLIRKFDDSNTNQLDSNQTTTKSSIYYLELRFDYLRHFLHILLNYSKNSQLFCIKFHETKGLRVLFSYLNNRMLFDKLNEYACSNTKSSRFRSLNSLAILLVASAKNLSFYADKYLNEWHEISTIDILFETLDQVSKLPDLPVLINISLANIIDDKSTIDSIRIKTLIENLVYMVKFLSNKLLIEDFSTKINKQESCLLDLDSDDHLDIIEWNIIDFLRSLYRLAVNDTIKYDMYDTHLMKEYLRILVFNGNCEEKEHAIRLLWQFCFDPKIAYQVKEDKELFEYLKNLDLDKQTKGIKENCSGLIWLLLKKPNESRKEKISKWIQQSDLKESLFEENKQIMISYNRDSRDLCLQVKSDLESAGFSVWIDVENISGSSLESMANAIEKSECVLICMTEKYKQSPNCRAEAEYAFQIKKPIIPLVMQKAYKPDGWLGIILGSKIYIDFTKYEFEDCMRRLKKEMVALFNKKYSFDSVEDTNALMSSVISSLTNQLNCETDWSEQDVDNWLKEKNFNEFIVDSVRPSDGKLLYTMYKMLETAPDSFTPR